MKSLTKLLINPIGKFLSGLAVAGLILLPISSAYSQEKVEKEKDRLKVKRIWQGYASLDRVSKYVSGFSGDTISEDPSLQVCLGIANPNVNFSVWADYSLGDKNTDKGVSEIDPQMNITLPENKFVKGNFYAGLFFVPGEQRPTGEIGVNLSPKIHLPFDVNFYLGQGILNDENGRIVIPSVGRNIRLTDRLSAKLQGDAPYLDNYCGGNGLSHLAGKVSIGYKLGNGFEINGGVRKQFPIRDDINGETTWNLGINKAF